MIRARSQGREAALTALYQLDLSGELGDDSVEPPIREEEAPLADAREFARGIVAGVREHASDTDHYRLISRTRLDRIIKTRVVGGTKLRPGRKPPTK